MSLVSAKGDGPRPGLGSNLTAPLTSVFLLMAGFLSAHAAIPDPATLIFHPPRIERMVIHRTFEDESGAFFLMRYDGGNFVVKSSRTREGLNRKTLAVGDDISGHFRDKIWALSGDNTGNINVADLAPPATTNEIILDHQSETLLFADSLSRLERSFLTFGMEVPFYSPVEFTNGLFLYKSGGFAVQGKVEFAPSERSGLIKFTCSYQKIKTAAENPEEKIIYYISRGELSLTNYLPVWFEMIQSVPGKKDEYLGRAEVLEVQLAKAPLPDSAFSIDENVSGYTALVYATNNLLVVSFPKKHQETHIKGLGK